MNNYLGTQKCIICGKDAKFHCGNVKAREKMALGNLIDVRVLAGWCSQECYDSIESDKNGCYGIYDNEKHGTIMDCYKEMFGNSLEE